MRLMIFKSKSSCGYNYYSGGGYGDGNYFYSGAGNGRGEGHGYSDYYNEWEEEQHAMSSKVTGTGYDDIVIFAAMDDDFVMMCLQQELDQ